MGRITNYIKERPTAKTESVNARISKDLYNKANKIRVKKNHSWTDIIIASLKVYVEENKQHGDKRDDKREK